MGEIDTSWGSYLVSRIPPAWQEVLDPAIVDHVRAVGDQLSARVGHEHIVPSPEQVFRALEVPPEQVSVLLIGQDPYPTAGHAMGLSFSVPKGVSPLPPSAKNIRAELVSDLGIELPGHFDLSDWVSQGVLLLNRHLTTQVGNPGAHHRLGWTAVTDEIVRTVVQLNPSLVSILWGKQAAQVSALLGDSPRIESAHPSPLSAHRGFFGSRPFSRANALLEQSGRAPIDWSVH